MTNGQHIKIRLENFIDQYIDILIKNPYLPAFILNEINRNPQFLAKEFQSQRAKPEIILEMFEKEMKAGTIRKMNPSDLIINILSLSIFPFTSKPLMSLILFENDQQAYNLFLEERKKTIKDFILNAILLENN